MNDITVEDEIKIIHDIQDDKEMFDAQMIDNLKKRIAGLKAENELLRDMLDEAMDLLRKGGEITPTVDAIKALTGGKG